MKLWSRADIDFRTLIKLKNILFDSHDLDSNNSIPLSEFRRIRGSHDDGKIKN